MAISFSLSINIDAPPGRVYDVATDIQNAGDWMQNLVRIEMLTDGEFRVGTRWREIRKMFGKDAAEEFEVRACEPSQSFTLWVDGSKGSSKRGEYLFVHRLAPADGGTNFELDATISGMGLMGKLFGWMMKGAFAKAIQKDLEALKAHIENRPSTQ